MCGRFVSSSPPDEIARYFDVGTAPESLLEPSYNVAPTNDVYVVFEQGGERRLDTMHWGLVPFWAKDAKIGNRMINARCETLASKNAFRQAFRKRRCLIPADGFYEWKKVPGEKRKQPYYIQQADGAPLAIAGLWESWRPDPDRPDELHSCTIVTGPPNDRMSRLHDRMPVILPPGVWSTWLDPDNHDTDRLGRLLVPAPSEVITFHPVSTEVNNPRTEGERLVAEVEPEVEHTSDAASDTGPADGGADS